MKTPRIVSRIAYIVSIVSVNASRHPLTLLTMVNKVQFK